MASEDQPSTSAQRPESIDAETPPYFFAERNVELNKLFKLTGILYKQFYEFDSSKSVILIDVDRSVKICGALSTVFSYLRKKANPKQAAGAEIYGNYSIKINNKSFTAKDVANIFEALKEPFNFKLATPLMHLLTAFQFSLDEVKLGMSKFTQRRSDPQKPYPRENICFYGLGNCHFSLLTGVTFPPERRTALLEGLGPLTLSILLLNDKRPMYADKIERALKKSIEMLPMAEQIASCLKSSEKSTTGGLLRHLGELLLLTSHRSIKGIYFVLEALWVTVNDSNINDLYFDGAKGLLFYNKHICSKLHSMKTSADASVTRQMVFHAMFGTNIEDLGLLEAMTGVAGWVTRRNAEKFFVKRGSASSVTFEPISFVYISKLLKSNPTKFFSTCDGGTVQPMLVGGIGFAGYRKRKFSQAFMKYINPGRRVFYGTDPIQLSYVLNTMRQDILKNTSEEELKVAGTTEWLKYDSATGSTKEVDAVFVPNSTYFSN